MAEKFVTSLTSENLLVTWSVQLPEERATKVERMRSDEDDNIYVVDSLNKCVKVFDVTGELLQRFPPNRE
jgi:sugar lactone lactonase YvrE